MKLTGNLSLFLAALLLIYPLIPDFPKLRSAIKRSNNVIIGPFYALFFVLTPRFLRLIIASLTMWGLLIAAMASAIQSGGLDWIGVSRIYQGLLTGAACFSMAEISVLNGLGFKDSNYCIPGIVRAISPWAAWVLPTVVMAFVLFAINPQFMSSFPSWIFRAPLFAAVTLALPIGAVLFVRWLTPVPIKSRPA